MTNTTSVATTEVPPPHFDSSLTTPTFDVNESVAAKVLEHVEDPLLRLSLAAVSTTWRRVVKNAPETSSALWPKHGMLLLEGALAARLTDARVDTLLAPEYAGPNLRVLQIRGASPAFTGKGLGLHMRSYYNTCSSATSFRPASKLHTITLIGCEGVKGADVSDAFDELFYTGDTVSDFFGILKGRGDRHWHCSFAGGDRHRRRNLHDPLPYAKYDYWECDDCTYVLEERYRCIKCERMMCVECEEILSEDFCKYCGVFMCHDCFLDEKALGAAPATFIECDAPGCYKKVCATCSLEDGHKAVSCEYAVSCNVYCAECARHCLLSCEDCSKRWCSEYCGGITGEYCQNVECQIILCEECNEARGERRNIASCSGCSSSWCSECWGEAFDLHEGMCIECYSK